MFLHGRSHLIVNGIEVWAVRWIRWDKVWHLYAAVRQFRERDVQMHSAAAF